MQGIGKKKQYQINQDIEALLHKKGNNPKAYNEVDRFFISQYSGYGGLGAEGKEGKEVLYEYYTPSELVKVMWQLLLKHGFNGGQVLEPSAGTGRFLFFAPDTPNPIYFTALEISKVSSTIAKIMHPYADVRNQYFEQLFLRNRASVKDDVEPRYDAIIGNPPYGSIKGGQGGKYLAMGEAAYTKATRYDEYFITRSLDLLKSGGLLCFVVGSASGNTFLSTGNNIVKEQIAKKANLLEAYLLPEKVFRFTDVVAEILVFQKF